MAFWYVCIDYSGGVRVCVKILGSIEPFPFARVAGRLSPAAVCSFSVTTDGRRSRTSRKTDSRSRRSISSLWARALLNTRGLYCIRHWRHLWLKLTKSELWSFDQPWRLRCATASSKWIWTTTLTTAKMLTFISSCWGGSFKCATSNGAVTFPSTIYWNSDNLISDKTPR